MRKSWQEIRASAAQFARDWAGIGYEKGQTQLFYNGFFNIFDVPVRRVASFEVPVKVRDSHGFIDLFWKGVLLVEQKSMGRDLNRAREQALDYFPGLSDAELPRFVLVSDFQNFELYDLDTPDAPPLKFPLADLPKHVESFGFIMGVEKRIYRDQDPVNIRASELVGRLHDALEADGFTGHDLEQFLVRLVFCLFADDTGIFNPRDSMMDLLERRTAPDGSDTGQWLTQLFQTLNTPEDRRSRHLDPDLSPFPYINGALFAGALQMPHFNAEMREMLLNACRFDWSAISPAIFGSLFQSVMEPGERRRLGAHYTTEKNILKVIGPLFMDGLRAEFDGLKARRDTRRSADLQRLQQRLAAMRFLDPACGCGNFLIIAYREMRLLELDIIRELRADGQRELDASALSLLNVDQFYGIEIEEFPARIAETALWMMDHLMNNRLSLEFGQVFVRIPLRAAPHIHHADALTLDWATVLPPDQCSHVLGNPPFVGAKYQSERQRAQVRDIAALGGSGGTLDFVAAWFIKAAAYVRGTTATIGFVATNSITQGEQVGQLWPILFDRHHLAIHFAHRTFAWGSDARGKAHVHVVIIGLCARGQLPAERRLFSYADLNGDPSEQRVAAITAYLTATPGDDRVVVHETARALNGWPRLITGSKPIDDGHFIFTDPERDLLLAEEPGAADWLRPFIGAEEYINGGQRWILALHDIPPATLRALPKVVERVQRVRDYRLKSPSKPTQALAETPTLYHINVLPTAPFLVLPRVSSERRDYAPIGWVDPPVIPSDAVQIVEHATLDQFALLTARMHMAWLRTVAGRLKSDYRYSIGLVYNTFPLPPLDAGARARLAASGRAILAARAAHPGATLADLYDPDTMPPALKRAHLANDALVDRLYGAKFADDAARVAHLLGLYQQLTAPMLAIASKPNKSAMASKPNKSAMASKPNKSAMASKANKSAMASKPNKSATASTRKKPQQPG